MRRLLTKKAEMLLGIGLNAGVGPLCAFSGTGVPGEVVSRLDKNLMIRIQGGSLRGSLQKGDREKGLSTPNTFVPSSITSPRIYICRQWTIQSDMCVLLLGMGQSLRARDCGDFGTFGKKLARMSWKNDQKMFVQGFVDKHRFKMLSSRQSCTSAQ